MCAIHHPVYRWSSLFLSCAVIALITGCGGPAAENFSRYKVNGSVTWKGKPIPYGEIVFEPDGTKGNKGPLTRGIIENGKYDIEAAHGAVAGPLRVRISGYDGQAPAGGGTMPHGQSLFSEYLTHADQPKAEAKHDFDVLPTKGK